MSALERDRQANRFLTHEVENQAPPLFPYDAWATDLPLREAMQREGASWATDLHAKAGVLAGGELQPLAFAANENKPKLKLFDRYGHRVDEVEFHPSYHRLMEVAVTQGVSSLPWRMADQPGAHVARMGLSYLLGQADQGTGCPITMTYACVPSLRHSPRPRSAASPSAWG
jgi:putative acyl-CoA dehydrogenase